ncbi:Lsr2 family DNA-binding protein, partial [Streptomyces syringium]|uniref:Lsr2 family DNA-binding protein n=1 Tax=Streptomyces syringium TaxID=76729 RepID=UPI0033F80B5F
RDPGRFRDAVRAGEFVGGDPLPESAKAVSSGMSEREKNDRIREWGRNQGYELKDRGRLPLHVRKAYELAHQSEAVAA